MKYAVETLFIHVWENCWHDGHGSPTLFDTREDAEQAIKDHITDCINAVEGGIWKIRPTPPSSGLWKCHSSSKTIEE